MITKILSKFLLKMPLDYSFINDNNNTSNTSKNQRRKTIKRKPKYYDDDNANRPAEIKKITRDFIKKVEKDVPMPMEPDYLEEADGLADFEPIEAPSLNKKENTEVESDETYEQLYKDAYENQAPMRNTDTFTMEDLNKLNNGDNAYGDYIRQYKLNDKNNVPYFMQQKNNQPVQGSLQIDERLNEKINYMIKLLEDHHDEKTGHVTEELILYGFLGIFIIFVVDSFVRVGKYTR